METKIYIVNLKLNKNSKNFITYLAIINSEGTTLINQYQCVVSFGYITIEELCNGESVKDYKFITSIEL